MTRASQHDAWQAGDSYDAYMGRWSRQVAPRFLEWLGAGSDLDWLDVGCGTGALTAAVLGTCRPRGIVAVEPAEGFLRRARVNVPDRRVEFRQGDAQELPVETASRDVIVSGLVLNFVPDGRQALTEMKRVARPGGTIAYYVWDYPGSGVEFMRAFWSAATELDPGAADLAESRRFPFCTREGLAELAGEAGLASVESTSIEIPTVFDDFEDYWHPFTLGAGPAPGYYASLTPDAQRRLREKLLGSLPYQANGTIPFAARAWAIRATA